MSRKGENIYKRKDGRWEARYIISHDEKGHARYKSVYDKSYTGVKKKKQEALRELEPSQEKRDSVLFRILALEWSALYRKSFLMDRGIRHYAEPGVGYQDVAFRFSALAQGDFNLISAAYYNRRMEIPGESFKDARAVSDFSAEYGFLRKELKNLPEKWKKWRFAYWQAYFQSGLELYEGLDGRIRPMLSARMNESISFAIKAGEFDTGNADPLTWDFLKHLIKSPEEFDREWKHIDWDMQIDRAQKLMRIS